MLNVERIAKSFCLWCWPAFWHKIKCAVLILGWIPLCTENSLQKQPFLLTPLHWGHFHKDEHLWLRDRNSTVVIRAVKKVLISRLIMNSRQLWNLHQRYKFLRVEASRDILKFGVSEMVFPGVFKRYFPMRTPCFFITIHTGLGTIPSRCPRRSMTLHSLNVSHQSKPV